MYWGVKSVVPVVTDVVDVHVKVCDVAVELALEVVLVLEVVLKLVVELC